MLVIYGGSFNPPTKAHLEIVNKLENIYPEAKIIIMPVSKKNYFWKDNLADDDIRYQMLKLAFPDLEISDYEFKKEKYQGTYLMLKEFQKLDDDLYFVIGSDNLVQMPEWANFNSLISEFNFILLRRPTDEIDFSKFSGYEDHFKIINMNSLINATQIRENVDKYKDWLLDSVYQYIKENKIYQGD